MAEPRSVSLMDPLLIELRELDPVPDAVVAAAKDLFRRQLVDLDAEPSRDALPDS